MKLKLLKNYPILIITISLLSSSCQNSSVSNSRPINSNEVVHYSGLDKNTHKNLQSQNVLAALKNGNSKFVNSIYTSRDHSLNERSNLSKQYPSATILSCFDSRIPVEDIFSQGMGDLLVLRVGGNIVNQDILGSMEYGAEEFGSKLIVVLGHKNCTSIRNAIDKEKDGNVSFLTYKILPAVEKSKRVFGPKTNQNAEYVNTVIKANVENSISEILQKSPKLKNLYTKGEIDIVGAIYDMRSGQVEFL